MKHFHTLRKVRGSKGPTTTFQCNHPECSWRQPANMIEGKKFQCNFCEHTYIFKPEMKRIRFPHCPYCTTSGQSRKKTETVELSDDILKDMGMGESRSGE
jgi:hypothetical protein